MNTSFRRVNQDIKEILSQTVEEPAFEGTVFEGQKRRFTVISEKDRHKYLTPKQNEELNHALFYHLGKIEEGREKEGKNPFNCYVVINLDEPYIDEIIEIMKRNGHWK